MNVNFSTCQTKKKHKKLSAAKIKFLAFFIYLFLLSTTKNLDAEKNVRNREIEAIGTASFSECRGFEHLLQTHQDGNEFEIESAFCAMKRHHHVDGFGLLLRIDSPSFACLPDGSEFELVTTEYDVVTSKETDSDKFDGLLIESKSTKKPPRAKTKQFIKQRNVQQWCQFVSDEIEIGNLSLEARLRSKGNPYIVVNGTPTLGIDVELVSPWIEKTDDLSKYKAQWKDLFKNLSENSKNFKIGQTPLKLGNN